MCKMTDNEIIKAIKCCTSSNSDECLQCPLHNDFYPNTCHYKRTKNAADLINRQKAEIKCLKREITTLKYDLQVASEESVEWKTLAIKEFAERLKEKLFYECGDINYTEVCDTKRVIDNLVKEMTEEMKQ